MTTTTPTTRDTHNIILAWAVLIGLTLISWWLGTDHGSSAETATTIVLLAAFAKVFLIGNTFMELRHAAPWLRRIFGLLSTTICAVLLVLYYAN